jgi:uronate dehydrogenase
LRDWVEGDLEDRDALVNSAAGMDAILHLAACPDEADFVSALVPANIVGLYNVFEAARENGLRRFVLASSCRVAELSDSPGRIGVEARDPADMYGLTKLWAEEMGRMYSRLTSIHVVAARLGWVLRDTAELNEMQSMPRGPQLYLSHRDAAEFFCCCLEAPLPPYAVVYALSKQAHGELFDMRPARRLLGFEPRDTFPHGTTFAESD